MANWYVYSGAAGTGTGADWTNAYLTLKAAAEAAGTVAGDNIWVAHDHAETTAAVLTITTKNTATAPGTVMCVNRAGSVPPVAADLRTTATVTTTGASAMSLLGVANAWTHWYGITFNCGTGAVSSFLTVGASGVGHWLKNCKLKKLGTTASVTSLEFSGTIRLENTTFQFGNVGDSARFSGHRSEWLDTPTAIEGAIFPTVLLAPSSLGAPEVLIRGIDLSLITGTLVASGTAGGVSSDVRFVGCKLASSVVPSISQTSPIGSRVTLINCDSAATNYRNEHHRHAGDQLTETTIFRNGGASDGATPIAWKLFTTVDTRWVNPFEAMPIRVWNNAPGARTVDVYGYWNSGVVPNNDDIWIDVEYLGSAGSPISITATSGKASALAVGTPVVTDIASIWGGGDTTTRFRLSTTLTTALRGLLTATVKVGRANATFYIDPKVVVT